MSAAPDIAELARQGVGVIVGTCDAARRPAVTRGWGPVLAEDGGALRLCVDAPPGSPTRANLEGGGRIAVTLSRPTSYVSVQVKGPVRALGEPDTAALAAADAHIAAFLVETAALGVPEVVIRGTIGASLVAVELAVDERYDQTPGPDAGRAL